MGREKIEDLVCAPHLSYTQQAGHPNTSLQQTSSKYFHKGRILYLHLSVHITHNLQNTADMARFISFRPSVVLPLFFTPSFQIGDFFLLHLISKNVEEVKKARGEVDLNFQGDHERVGGGAAPGAEASILRGSNSQVTMTC